MPRPGQSFPGGYSDSTEAERVRRASPHRVDVPAIRRAVVQLRTDRLFVPATGRPRLAGKMGNHGYGRGQQ